MAIFKLSVTIKNMNTNKRLYKSKDNRVISGVLGGVGEYFNVDPVILRVVYIVISAFAWFVPGIVAYILMAIVIPTRPATIHEEAKVKDEPKA